MRQSCCVLEVTFSPTVRLPAHTHTGACIKGGQNHQWISVDVNKNVICCCISRVKSKLLKKHCTITITRPQHTQLLPNFMFQGAHLDWETCLTNVIFDLPSLTLSACFYLLFPSGSPFNVWHPEAQFHCFLHLHKVNTHQCSFTQTAFYEEVLENELL